MRVLVVLSEPPLPEGGAPGRCALGLIRGLLAHGLDVRVLAARRHFAPEGAPPPDLPVEVVTVEREAKWRARTSRWWHPRGELARSSFGERVRAEATDADVVHLEETETSWCDRGIGVPSLVHVHYLVRRDRPLGRVWERRFRDGLEFELAERAAIRRYRYLVASSPLIANELRRRAPNAFVVHAPLTLDAGLYEPATLEGPPVAGVIGSAAWPPTAAALHRLVSRVWPLVRREVPEARLVIAGRGTTELGLPGDGRTVEVVGGVASATAFLRGLSVLVYPLDRGSGMKVKVLEAIASGVPVVTTSPGAEGIAAGAGVVVEEDDEALAAAAARMLVDAAERRERGAAARTAFLERYAPEPATEPLLDLYERMRERR